MKGLEIGFRFDIHNRFRQGSERQIRRLFFLKGGIEERGGFRHSQLSGPCLEGAVPGHLVVLDRLRGSSQTSIEGGHPLELGHDVLPFLGDAHDGFALLGLSLLAENLEHLFEALDLSPRFALMLDEGGFRAFRLRVRSRLSRRYGGANSSGA